MQLIDQKQWSPYVWTSLESAGVEFILSHDGKVSLSCIEHKYICLLFSAKWCRPCNNFMTKLLNLYKTLNSTSPGSNLEILFVSLDHDESSFLDHFRNMPWLAVPFDQKISQKLRVMFHVEQIPSLIPLVSVDGKFSVEEDAVRLVDYYGVDAFPFDAKRRKELEAIDEARSQGGRLEELIGSKDRNFLICKDDSKISISKLVGKTIGLYFGAHWCPPSRSFTEMLVKTYNELENSEVGRFEVVFISMDRDENEFMASQKLMPWLAIPYNDKIRHDLSRIFDVKWIPTLIILGAEGNVISRDGRVMITRYGPAAFPFTEKRVKEVEGTLEEEGARLPREVSDPRHEHVLKLDMARNYVCDVCQQGGRFWVFSCRQCDFDLHPCCAEKL
ncbi:Kinase C-like zinc finger protein [Rhynchospora pubera]|uniref:protein-disulfide reductase n=1 Tax=Rhynchospora pubera TaxID=906938 RepID=A0AAV8DAZ8_9POAL|nr:Kinase C-like zinc finger protein [Rhynchospora pubera]